MQLIEACEHAGVTPGSGWVQAWDVAPQRPSLPNAREKTAPARQRKPPPPSANRPRRVLVAGSHTQQVEARDTVACERVPVSALLQSLAAERPELACSPDVPDSVGDTLFRHLRRNLSDELGRALGFEVATAAATRWVRRLGAVDVRAAGRVVRHSGRRVFIS